MKKSYTPPKITVHGTIEELTQFFDAVSARDTLFTSGNPAGIAGEGSADFRCRAGGVCEIEP